MNVCEIVMNVCEIIMNVSKTTAFIISKN